jgi:anaerobic magnesium-protoporphyrin IX monomethyl ester cyclase
MSESVPFKIVGDIEITSKGVRDTSRPVILIGFQDQENLGLGYLASTLRLYGYRVEVFDFEEDAAKILKAAQALDPILIGFSLIFQFYVHRFRSVICHLRDNGVSCHFTMGGHFPSLSYQHTLELVPELDSVVRFEGEITLLELVDSLVRRRDWRTLKGIAYRQAGETMATPLRELIHDLDELPYPDRTFAPNRVLGRLSTPILASRGCARTCSFCSIHMFYRAAPGKVVRTRKPDQVVREMRKLHQERGITIFLFQDDDFPLFGPVWRRWAREFVDELHRSRLPGRVIWKINCRADAVDPDLMAAMRDAGLFLVYMGLESGSEEGLKTLHKQITVEQNLRAVRILKELGLRFEYGFMLFEPSTTFESVRDNLQFLRTIVGDGSAAASFCRMVPYDGTPIKDQLAREGRLRGDICHPDYDFLDPRVGHFFHALNSLVHVSGWIHGIQALTPQLNYAWNELAVMERLFPLLPGLPEYKAALREVTQGANELLFRVVEDTSYVFTDGKPDVWTGEELRTRCQEFLERLVDQRNAFVCSTQDLLERALQQDAAEEVACTA